MPGGQMRALVTGAAVGIAIGWAISSAGDAVRPRAADAPSPEVADSLVRLWIDSAGGMDTYERFQTATYTVTTVWYDSLTGRVVRTRPRFVWLKKGPFGEETRVERTEAGGRIVQGFNGREAWATLDGRRLPDSAQAVREAEYVAGDLFYWPGLPFKLRDAGVFLHYLGLVRRPGVEPRFTREPPPPPGNRYHAVRVTFGAGVGDLQDEFVYYFAPGRAFPIEVTYVEAAEGVLNRVSWGPTYRAGDIRYPYVERREAITRSGRPLRALVITDLLVNPEIDQAVFDPP